ncbi:MAG: hypothetical protein V3V39_11715 [Desulfobacterales bacterium]
MEGQSVPKDYIHPVLNEEIRTISGHYILRTENRLPFNDRQVLYFIGCAVVDSSCCGTGGCAYALVPGYIRQWKYKLNAGNLSVTKVELIRDKGDRQQLGQLIKEKEGVQQVNFIT